MEFVSASHVSRALVQLVFDLGAAGDLNNGIDDVRRVLANHKVVPEEGWKVFGARKMGLRGRDVKPAAASRASRCSPNERRA